MKSVSSLVGLCQQMKTEKYNVEDIASPSALVSLVMAELGITYLFAI